MSTKESKTAVRRNQERLKTVMPAMSWRGEVPPQCTGWLCGSSGCRRFYADDVWLIANYKFID